MNLEPFLATLFSVQENQPNHIEYAAPDLKENIASINPTPDNPPWSSVVAFFVWIGSVAFIVILPNLFLTPYISQQDIDFSDNAELIKFIESDPTATLIRIIAVIPAHILTLVMAWIVITKFNKFSFRKTLGWNWGSFRFWHCLIITGLFYILAFILTYIFGEQDHELLRILRSSKAAVYVITFLAVFTAPIVEEVIYRGILYSAFQRSFGVNWAIAIVTFIFASVHFLEYKTSPVAILMVCLLSLVITLVRAKTKNLLPCIVLHMFFNGMQMCLFILQQYLASSSPTQQPASLIDFLK